MKGNGCALRSCILDMICRNRKSAEGMSRARKAVAKIDVEVGEVDVCTHDGGNAALMDMKLEGIEMRGRGVVVLRRLTETEWGLETRRQRAVRVRQLRYVDRTCNGNCARPRLPFLYKDFYLDLAPESGL